MLYGHTRAGVRAHVRWQSGHEADPRSRYVGPGAAGGLWHDRGAECTGAQVQTGGAAPVLGSRGYPYTPLPNNYHLPYTPLSNNNHFSLH